MSRKKVLVTGGAGFLGSHVTDSLSSRGYDVTIFDIKKSSYLRSDQQQIVGNLMDQNLLNEAVAGCDYVYHLAGIADIDECHVQPVDTIRFNVVGTTYVLDACVKNNVKRLVFASSAYVYSNKGSFYRVSKQACEQLIDVYQKNYGLDYVILRYGSLYGERSDRHNSIYRVLKEALVTEKVIYGGSGEEKREFIHVNDAADLSVEVLDEKYRNENIILTGPSSIKYSELLDMVKEILNDRIEIEYTSKKVGTHYRVSPYSYTPKLGKKLINNPMIDLGQGLLNLISEIDRDLNPDDHYYGEDDEQ